MRLLCCPPFNSSEVDWVFCFVWVSFFCLRIGFLWRFVFLIVFVPHCWVAPFVGGFVCFIYFLTMSSSPLRPFIMPGSFYLYLSWPFIKLGALFHKLQNAQNNVSQYIKNIMCRRAKPPIIMWCDLSDSVSVSRMCLLRISAPRWYIFEWYVNVYYILYLYSLYVSIE